MKRWHLIAGLGGFALLAWEVVASYLTVYVGRIADQVDPWDRWFEYISQWGAQAQADYPDYITRRWLLLFGLASVVICGFVGFALRQAIIGSQAPRRARLIRWPWERGLRPSQPAVTDNHGHARWLTEAEARRIFKGPKYSYRGKVVGALGSGRLLFDTCEVLNGLSLEFVPSGGGKTQGAATRCAHWHGPLVVMDPKAELGPMLYEAKEAEGYRVVFLNPNPTPLDADCRPYPWARCCGSINVLDWINVSDPLASMHVHTAVDWMFAPSEKQVKTNTGDFFHLSGRDLVACLVAHTLWAEPISDKKTGEIIEPAPRTLRTVRQIISRGPDDCIATLAYIKQHSPSSMARHLAGEIVGTQEAREMWPGIYKEAAQKTSWLTVDAFADLVSGNSMMTTDITDQKVAVFVQVPLAAVHTMPTVAQVLLASLFNAMILADGNVPADRVHFEIDESKLFGRMAPLDHLRQYGRAYRVSMHMSWLSVADMEEVWGIEGRRTWFECATWRAYSSIRDPQVAREISETCGRHGVMAFNDSVNSSAQGGVGFGRVSRGMNSGLHEIGKNLLDPYQVAADIDPRQQLILGLQYPLLLWRSPAWARRELRDEVMPSRFYKEAV